MARLLFEKQGIRRRGGPLASGVTFVVYTDVAGTVLADISATSGGSAIAGSEITTADIDGLGPAAFRFYGPTDDTDTLYLRCPADTGLGVQEIEADEDERLDALEAGGGGGVTDHGALTGLADDDHPHYATDTDLSTHAADTTAIHGITDTSALATSSSVTSAVSTHAGLTDPHTGYVLESLYDAKGDLLPASADNTPAKLTVGANDTVLTADSSTGTGVKWGAVPVHGSRHAPTGADPFGALVMRYRSGLYYSSNPLTGGSTLALTLNRLTVFPVFVGQSITLDRIGVFVNNAGTAGAVVRLGIYSDDATGGYPGNLLLDAGTVDSTGTGAKEITISQALTPGLYWIGGAAQVAVCTVLSITEGLVPVAASNVGATNSSCAGYIHSGATGALPTPFTASPLTDVSAPRVFFRTA